MIFKSGLKNWIALNKVKFQRGYSYIAAVGIPFLVARSLGEMFPNWDWMWFFIPALILVWVIGEIDYRSGLFGNETAIAFLKNPEWNKRMEELKKNE